MSHDASRSSHSSRIVHSSRWQAGPELGGIHEWRLDNGLTLLILPDRSQPSITVNNTFLVGSRLEKRGERGMAHLLEHMLFKGTPSFADIPQALRDRGALFNGTTWLDRTHYYETLPSEGDNLDFALKLEAERMSATVIEDGAFATELDVVRNELLRGENSPSRVLFQRLMRATFLWHGYGHPTIGLLDDLGQMTAQQLRDFYHHHYVPNRAVLVVGGDVDQADVLTKVLDHFGSLPPGKVDQLDQSTLREPAQDGPREISLQRVAEVSELAAAYHVPAGGHADFPYLKLVTYILGLRPTGRLYQRLVEPGVGAAVSCMALSLHDPGVFVTSVDVPDRDQLSQAEEILLHTAESELKEGIRLDELERARNEFLKRRSLELAESRRLAVNLTESIALGDWRYYFLQQERIETATLGDLQRVCETYLSPENRTIGRLIAGKRELRVGIPDRSSDDLLAADVSMYQAPTAGEPFDPSPRSMEKHVTRNTIGDRLRVARLARRTRADRVTLSLNLRFGNAETLRGKESATSILAEWLMRGTRQRNHVAVQDAFRQFRAWLQSDGFRGGLTYEGQVPREYLEDYLLLFREMLQQPELDADEFRVLQKSSLAELDQQRTQPAAIAQNLLKRRLIQHPPEHVLYMPTLDEQREWLASTTVDSCRELYEQCIGGQSGEWGLVGPDLSDDFLESSLAWLGQWKAPIEPERFEEPAQDHAGDELEIELRDKSNVALAAGVNLPLRDDHPDYGALILSNYVFGGATLVSRLSSEVRGKRGLSYSISSSLTGHPVDLRGRFAIQAMTNPENRVLLVSTIKQELLRWLNEGLSEEEVAQGKASLLKTRQVSRAGDRSLAGMLATQAFADRDLSFIAELDDRISALTSEEVNEATRRWINPENMVYVTVGELR